MLYETLKIAVAVLGPLVIYTTVISTMQVPDQIMALPAAVRHTIEAIGALFIVGAWFMTYASGLSISGGLALIGLLLLITPLVARQLSRTDHLPTETWS